MVSRSPTTSASLDDADLSRYLEETVRVWLGLATDAPVEPPRLPDALARALLRLEEHDRADRDAWGRWDFHLSQQFEGAQIWEAPIDRWVADRRAELSTRTPLEPLWPEARRFAVCLTHDVDLVSPRSTPLQVVRHARAGLDRDGSILVRLARPPVRIARALRSGLALAPSLRETLELSISLEADRGTTASYLFTVPPARGIGRYDCVYAPEDACSFRSERRRIADMIRTVADEGFDVGLHGSYRAGVEPAALKAERERLERSTGVEITTTRQHLLHWDVRWTPPLQEQAGFEVDSSLGFNRNVGFRGMTSLPFRWFGVGEQRPLRLLEVPLVLQDVGLLGEWGLELDVEQATEVVRQFFERARNAGSAVTIVFHPDKLVHDDWRLLYESVLDLAIAHGAWITSLAGLGAWWRERATRILGA
jgi:hypothetical protein